MKRILFVFDWVGISAERTEAGLLRRGLDPGRYEIEALSLHRNPLPVGADIPGVDLDDACHGMDDDGRIAYLAARIAGGGYDAVVAFQGSRPVHPAYRRLCGRSVPPLVEYGNLSRQVFSDLPKSHTARFVAAGRGVLEAAVMVMPPETCRLIPGMVDLGEYAAADRKAVRRELGAAGERDVLVAWVGRLDPRSGVDAFVSAAADAQRPSRR